jgi:hypothetical protein
LKTLPLFLGMVRGSEQYLAKSFGAMALRHSSDFEIHQLCRLFEQWCVGHLDKLESFVTRHGIAVNPDPARVKKALFDGSRIGGFGLLRDLQDLLLLTHQARTGWTALAQAAKQMKESDLAETSLVCAGETDRQIDWLCTHIKVVAPQALTVPVDAGKEGKDLMEVAFKLVVGAALVAVIGSVIMKRKA